MKRVILTVVSLFTFMAFTQAQGFHLGAKAGVNLGKIQGQSFKDGFNSGFQAGGYATIDFSKVVGIQPEVLFNQTNTKVSQTPADVAEGLQPGENIHLNYLSIPILLRLNASKLLTFHVGPQFSILTNNHETTFQNAKDAFKGGDLAAVLGAQLNLGALNIYGRYNIGLQNINDITSSDKWKTQTISLGLGLRIL